MRILIIGGAGMLGHQLWRSLHDRHDVWVTLRRPVSSYSRFHLFREDHSFSGIDVSSIDSLLPVFRRARPEVVINCVGIIKQLREAHNPVISLTINSLLPHRLADLCGAAGARFLHISTDCVFSGRTGNYTEQDLSDAEDLYGRTKLLGEVHDSHALTLRTSIIGRELESRSGLIEWFLSQSGKTINGFSKAIYTGFTTLELCRIIDNILLHHPSLSGLWQVSSDPINKFDLLQIARRAFNWPGEILPDAKFVCDRSLNSARFRAQTGYRPPSWDSMLAELAQSPV